MATASSADGPRALAAAGVAIGAVAGMLLSAWLGSRSAPLSSPSLVGLALIGATAGAAAGLLLGGAAGIVVRLLAAQPIWLVAAVSGFVVGSLALTALLWLGITAYAAPAAFVTALLLSGVTGAGVGWRQRPG